MFHDGVVDLYPEGVSGDTIVLIGVGMERLYRLLGELVVVGSSGWLDLDSDNDEASMRGSQMDISPTQSSMQVVKDASGSEGAATVAEDVMAKETNLNGGVVRRTSLAKEC